MRNRMLHRRRLLCRAEVLQKWTLYVVPESSDRRGDHHSTAIRACWTRDDTTWSCASQDRAAGNTKRQRTGGRTRDYAMCCHRHTYADYRLEKGRQTCEFRSIVFKKLRMRLNFWLCTSVVQIGSNENRRRLLNDGSLQIINLYPYDKGLYVCTADNGIGSPVRIEYQLDIVGKYTVYRVMGIG